jgi:hypothetical protein
MAPPVSVAAGAPQTLWPVLVGYGWKLLAALATALLVYYATEKIKGRYRVIQLTRRRRNRYYSQFAEVYSDRIEHDQQIATSAIVGHAIDRLTAPVSRRALKRLQQRADRPPTARQLFLAVRRGQVLGFLYVSVHLELKYTFIAYLATQKNSDIPADVTKRLLKKARERVSGFVTQPVFLFEVAPPADQSSRSRAKFRLFSAYAETQGLATKRVPLDYVQPDINPDSPGAPIELMADLYISAEAAMLDSLDRSAYLSLVRSIYLDIYPRSFSDSDLRSAFLEYAAALYSRLESEAHRTRS